MNAHYTIQKIQTKTMKLEQSPPPVQKKQNQGQLKQLIQSYYLEVGTALLPALQSSIISNDIKTRQNPNADKFYLQKRAQYYGKLSLGSAVIVLLCTMLGILDQTAVLAFGIFWGIVFTKYQAKLNHQLTEMLLYWMVLALITALQNILSLALFFMPFYHSLKLFLIISLLYPEINLKNKIYKEYFNPRLTHLMQSL